MGEYAEMALEQELNNMFEIPLMEDLSVWTCRDGRVLRVVDMETSHIQNTINILNRKDPLMFHRRIASLHRELKRRKIK